MRCHVGIHKTQGSACGRLVVGEVYQVALAGRHKGDNTLRVTHLMFVSLSHRLPCIVRIMFAPQD